MSEQVEACYDKLVSEGVEPAQYNQYTVSRDVDEFYTANQRFTEIMALCVEESEARRDLHPDWMLAIDKARRALDEGP